MVTLTDARGRVRVLTEAQFRMERGPSPFVGEALVPTRAGRVRSRAALTASNRGAFQCGCGRRFTWKPSYRRHANGCAA